MTINSSRNNQYWSQRYLNKNIGWDIGYPSTPLKTYFDQLEDTSIEILIPGAGDLEKHPFGGAKKRILKLFKSFF